MSKIVTSTANPKVKLLKSLHKNSTRKKLGLIVVEGAKEIAYAIEADYEPVEFFVCPDIYKDEFNNDDNQVTLIAKSVFDKVTYRGNVDGLIAVFKQPETTLDNLILSDNPFFLIVESVEKPGNLGAIVRTADGCGATGVIVCDQKADTYNPNVIRSSVGTVFSKQVVACSNEAAWDFIQKHEINLYGAAISGKSALYTDASFNLPLAIVLGTEHDGLSNFWLDRVSPVYIPMMGLNDSLNVSAAAAILAYEALRQRSR